MDSSFYQALYTNNEFAMAIGRLTMSSAKLESNIKAFIEAKGQKASQKATLGLLVKAMSENNQIDQTATEQLYFVLNQRNYFVHRLHASLSEYPSNESELTKFINRVASLCSEMEFFSKLISEAGADLTNKVRFCER